MSVMMSFSVSAGIAAAQPDEKSEVLCNQEIAEAADQEKNEKKLKNLFKVRIFDLYHEM